MEVIRASVGAGKTEAVLDVLVSTLARKPFAKVWVLLATRRQEDAFRQRLVEFEAGQQVYFNFEFFDFYSLYRRVLNIAGQPARGLGESARFALLRAVIQDLKARGQLRLYHQIAHKPGFVRIVAALIAELKQNQVYPAVYMEAAQASGTPKDLDLARIYEAYQVWLQDYDLVDQEGEGWLALARLQADPNLCSDLELVVADGFDQFTPVQARLLRLIGSRASKALVTLTNVPGREETIGRRFQMAFDTLTRYDADLSGLDAVIEHHITGRDGRAPAISQLIENIFTSRKISDVEKQSTASVQFIEAPDPAAEVGAVLRRVKGLLLDGCPPDEIMIAIRDWQRYQPHFLALAREYGLPLALHYGEHLIEHPMVAALLDALNLHARAFNRRELLDVLRSPYIRAPGLDAEQVEKLERISQQYTVTRGRDLWLDVIANHAHKPIYDDYGEKHPPILSESEAAALEWNLKEFFDYLTPERAMLVQNYVAWIEELIGSDPETVDENDPAPRYTLNMIAALKSAGDEATRARDLVAIQQVMNVLRGLVTAQELLSALDTSQHYPVEWEQFYGDLTAALGYAQLNRRPNRSGCVLVTTAADARGLPHKHVFILGLSEGIFPAQVSEDPLYLDSERLELRRRNVELRTQAERAGDDGIFYELICLPRDTLTLSRPTTQDGQPWPESHLWRAALDVFDQPALTRLRMGAVVPAAEAASLSEAALAAADGLSTAEPEADVCGLYNWLLTDQADFWRHIHQSRAVEARRLSPRAPHDHYSGKLKHPVLIAEVARTLHERRLWSATQLNDYGVSGFRYFAKRLLKLEPVEEPEEGLDVQQRGTLVHAILQMTYQGLLHKQLPIAPEHLDTALEILEAEAKAILRTAPQDYGFRPTALWEKEKQAMLRRLRGLVEQDFQPKNPITKAFGSLKRYPYRMEAEFGDAGSPAVALNFVGGGSLRVRGMIDRIDRIITPDGDEALIVMDYKTGSTPFPVEDMSAGRNFQMVLYILAAESFGVGRVAGGLFWHVRSGSVSGVLKRDQEDVFDAALGHVERYLDLMRAGDFAPQPTKPDSGRCVKYCDFSYLCRVCGLNGLTLRDNR